MAEHSTDVQIALLVQKVQQLEESIDTMKKDLDGLKSNALRMSGGLAVIVIVASVIGWAASFFSKLKLQ